MAQQEKPLRLIDEFSSANQFGYQKVDDTTVLERKHIPICRYTDSESTPWAVHISVDDFKSLLVTTYVQNAYDSGNKQPQVHFRNFSEVEGKQAIKDPHRALTELGGTPAPLDEIMDIAAPERKRALPKAGQPSGM
ncbi:MAG: hypothetical protein OXT65_05025 [Alphaproteobacteria bacterium]|nr:hypothetical protein [Alphaproteobacteria bacterium]